VARRRAKQDEALEPDVLEDPVTEVPEQAPERATTWPGEPEAAWEEPVEAEPVVQQEWVLPEDEVDEEERAPRRFLGVLLALFSVIVAAAVGFGAAAYNESRADSYVSRSGVLVDQTAAIALARDQALLVKLSALRVRYASIVASTSFQDEVAAQAGVRKGQVRGALGTLLPPVSLQVIIVARTGEPKVSEAIAGAAADLLIKRNDAEQKAASIPPRLQVKLVLVTPAEAGTRIGPDHKRSAELAAGAFVAVLVFAALARAGLRRRPRT
jgi:hypothetical protein